jgi:hypothetical protein
MYKNHGKHDQHYLIYKFACFSCNPNCRPCLNHSITNSHSQVQPNGIFHQDRRASGAQTPVILNLNDPIPFEWPPCLICCRNQALVYLSCWSQRQTAPPSFSQEALKNVYVMLISWIIQRIMSSRSKDLHEINVSTDFQWSMQDLGYLVNITTFEFLCRKLNCAHVGIVQIFIFFIKSARRFGRTISTLASQRVPCVPGILRPMTVHYWIWELGMMSREMHGW